MDSEVWLCVESVMKSAEKSRTNKTSNEQAGALRIW